MGNDPQGVPTTDVCVCVCVCVLFAFPVGITIGFSQEAYTVAEDVDGGIVTLRVAVLQGELGIPVFVNCSTVNGTAIGTLLCNIPKHTFKHSQQ